MPHSLRAVAFVAGVCVLYVIGYVAMSVTPAPWGLVWLPPLAVAAGAAWSLLERIDARMHRRSRDRTERGGEPERGTEPVRSAEPQRSGEAQRSG